MFTKEPSLSSRNFLIGYYISLYGVAIVLLWIGIFKFTPTEAAAIKPLVENHPLMGWLYNILSIQGVSN
ncbi:YkgB family protein, partial [Enterobacter hormaechei]|nr:YkgB family protein [Enterobacter hormaechei]